jgi:hypothetical protein
VVRTDDAFISNVTAVSTAMDGYFSLDQWRECNRLVHSEAPALAIMLGILHLDGNWPAAIESIQLVAFFIGCLVNRTSA